MFKDDSLSSWLSWIPPEFLFRYVSPGNLCTWFWQLLCPFVGVSISPPPSFMLSSSAPSHDLKWPHADSSLRRGSPLGNAWAFLVFPSVGARCLMQLSSSRGLAISLSPSHCIFLRLESRHHQSRGPQLLGTHVKLPKRSHWSPFLPGGDRGNASTLPHPTPSSSKRKVEWTALSLKKPFTSLLSFLFSILNNNSWSA